MVTITGYGELDVRDRWDRIFEQLSHSTRRQLVLTLSHEPPGTWIALPDALSSPRSNQGHDELAITLYHQHLPKLADDGYIKWRTRPFEATRGPRFQELAIIMETIVDQADSLPNHLVYGCELLENAQE